MPKDAAISRWVRGMVPPSPYRRRMISALAVGQAFAHQTANQHAVLPVLQVGEHRVVHADHVHQHEVVAVLICLDGVRERDLALQLLTRAEIHQDLIRYPLPADT